MAEADSGDTILIAPGFYREEGKLYIPFPIRIDADMPGGGSSGAVPGGSAPADVEDTNPRGTVGSGRPRGMSSDAEISPAAIVADGQEGSGSCVGAAGSVTIDISWGQLIFEMENEEQSCIMGNITFQSVGNPEPSMRDLPPAAMIDARVGRVTIQDCKLLAVSGGAKYSLCVGPDASAVMVRNIMTATVDIRGVCTMDHNEVMDCKGNGVMVSGEKLDPYTGDAMSTVINYNTISGCGGAGLWIRRRSLVSARGNYILDCLGDGVTVEDGRTVAILSSSKIESCKGRGVAVYGGCRVDLEDTFVERCAAGGVDVAGEGVQCTIMKCSVLDCGSHGIRAGAGPTAAGSITAIRKGGSSGSAGSPSSPSSPSCPGAGGGPGGSASDDGNVGDQTSLVRLEENNIVGSDHACLAITDTSILVISSNNMFVTPPRHKFDYVEGPKEMRFQDQGTKFERQVQRSKSSVF